jgi:hypothetical protein
MYVTDLAAPGTAITMPKTTLAPLRTTAGSDDDAGRPPGGADGSGHRVGLPSNYHG